MNKLKRGVFIVFEGGEACGKTLQRDLCFKHFSRKYDTISIREPGSTSVSEEIRKILLNKEMAGNIYSLTELLLYEAARAQFVDEILNPALKQGKLVLCDRFYYSTIAYQGFGRGINLKTIELCNKTASPIKPDLAFIFDIPYTESVKRMERAGKVKDRIEQESMEFHERVRQGYLYIAKSYDEAVLIDATEPPESISKEIIDKIEGIL